MESRAESGLKAKDKKSYLNIRKKLQTDSHKKSHMRTDSLRHLF